MNIRPRSFAVTATTVIMLSLAAAACGDGSESTLSEVGERGRSIAISNGCAACHGTDGQGGSGPTWQGLAGSEVELLDGTFVVADDAYLTRAITDPNADLRAGFNLQMPENNRLSDVEIADIVAYINEISQPETDG